MEYNAKYLDFKCWNKDAFGSVPPGSAFYYDQVIKLGNIRKAKVLDVGFGQGELLGYFQQNGHDVAGVELNEELVSFGKQQGFEVYAGDVNDIRPLANKMFEVITAFDVVEHMNFEQLVSFFCWVRNHMRQDGKLYIRFPEGASPFGLANQNGDFTHISAITKTKIEVLCGMADLKIILYADDVISSNYLCSHGWLGKAILYVLQSYTKIQRAMLKGFLYPASRGIRFGTNSLVEIAHR